LKNWFLTCHKPLAISTDSLGVMPSDPRIGGPLQNPPALIGCDKPLEQHISIWDDNLVGAAFQPRETVAECDSHNGLEHNRCDMGDCCHWSIALAIGRWMNILFQYIFVDYKAAILIMGYFL
jgi:hypothetical protein